MKTTAAETNLWKAIGFWNSPGAIDFGRVNFDYVWQLSKDEFWGIYTAGLKLWPAVSLFNFAVVKDVATRNQIGMAAGIAWGTYMSLVASH